MYRIENKRYNILAYYPTLSEAIYWLNKYKSYKWIQSNATIKNVH
jgi:hypothetical protein